MKQTTMTKLIIIHLFIFSGLLSAQDSNISFPVAVIEKKLKHDEFEIFRFKDLRFEGDIGKRVILRYSDRKDLQIKWRRALKGGHTFNNAPRFEIAAYELQKLFLDESDFGKYKSGFFGSLSISIIVYKNFNHGTTYFNNLDNELFDTEVTKRGLIGVNEHQTLKFNKDYVYEIAIFAPENSGSL